MPVTDDYQQPAADINIDWHQIGWHTCTAHYVICSDHLT